MGFNFHKSVKLGKNSRINLSKSGVGFSFGTKGMRYTARANKTQGCLYWVFIGWWLWLLQLCLTACVWIFYSVFAFFKWIFKGIKYIIVSLFKFIKGKITNKNDNNITEN